MVGIRSQLGILRSIAMYYGIPGRQAKMRRFYGQFIKDNDLCFDIGSHVGNRIKAWTALGAKVVAVEPQPHFFHLLQRWYGKNPRVSLVPHGVGPQSGDMELYVSSRTPTVTSFSREWMDEVKKVKAWKAVRWDQKLTVKVETLDQLIAKHGTPRFCKIDVEGFEYEVLAGLSQPIPSLSFEFIPASQQRAVDCIQRLTKLGDYEFNWSSVETMWLREPSWLSAEDIGKRLLSMPVDGRSGDVYARLKSFH